VYNINIINKYKYRHRWFIIQDVIKKSIIQDVIKIRSQTSGASPAYQT